MDSGRLHRFIEWMSCVISWAQFIDGWIFLVLVSGDVVDNSYDLWLIKKQTKCCGAVEVSNTNLVKQSRHPLFVLLSIGYVL